MVRRVRPLACRSTMPSSNNKCVFKFRVVNDITCLAVLLHHGRIVTVRLPHGRIGEPKSILCSTLEPASIW
jgi:hypothetical protein